MSAEPVQAERPKILLLGCGSQRRRRIVTPGTTDEENTFDYGDLTTLDNNPAHKPDFLWDLERRPLPFPDDSFDEIHAYDVLEHIGHQGDWRGFFEEWQEYHRILRPGGLFVGLTPSYMSMWAWGDPSHKRVFTLGTITFLVREEYEKQVGVTAMSDFRFAMGDMDWERVAAQEDEEYFGFILKAKKSLDTTRGGVVGSPQT